MLFRSGIVPYSCWWVNLCPVLVCEDGLKGAGCLPVGVLYTFCNTFRYELFCRLCFVNINDIHLLPHVALCVCPVCVCPVCVHPVCVCPVCVCVCVCASCVCVFQTATRPLVPHRREVGVPRCLTASPWQPVPSAPGRWSLLLYRWVSPGTRNTP